MKAYLIAALSAAALSSSASAADLQANPNAGHYEWHQPLQHGPRAPLEAPRRVWVPDVMPEMADCRCAMMKRAAADCMGAMHGMASPSSAQADG